ncbi:MAG: hypothetical protein IH892_23280, partial [Planctomycetes bacterium]|nr:hypothetical protein [Planctomycetota bacterium]
MAHDKTQIWSCVLLAAVLSMVSASSLADTLYHIATDGNDAWSGHLVRPNAERSDGPLASLTAARDRVRMLKAGGPLREPVRIIVEEGNYPLHKPLVLEAQDSGTAQCPITYEAARDAKPSFSGGRRITGFQRDARGIWKTKIEEVAQRVWSFEQLFVNGKRATRARTPNRFYFYMQKVGQEKLDSPGPAGATHRQRIGVRPEDLDHLSQLDPEALSRVNVMIYH